MLRFLRQYNKWILAVGGTLLLVSWALSGTISSFSQSAAQGGSSWATVEGGRKITFTQLEEIRRELRVLDALARIFQTSVIPIDGADRDPAHWYLLTKEAADAGLIGGTGDADILLRMMAEVNGSDPDTIAAMIASQAGTTPKIVRETLAKVNGITRLRELIATLPRYSDTRLEQAASESLLGIGGDVVVLDARTLTTPPVPTPDAAALAKQLETYGDIEPGKGPNGFGYRLPDRLKLEWIQVPEALVRKSIEDSNALDSLTLKKRFAADPTKFNAPPAQPGTDPLALFPAYEASVRQTVLDDLVAERMNEIAKFASDQLLIAQRGIPKEGAFLTLPADWSTRALDLKALAQAIGDQFKIPFPIYAAVGDRWQSIPDVEALPGVGTASTTRFGPNPMRLGQLLGKLREFGRGDDTVPMQVMVATPALRGANNDLFFARVIAADPSRAPATIEEAGPKLVSDLEAIERFQALQGLRAEILAQAVESGPRAVAERFGATSEFVARFQEADPTALNFGLKFPSSLPGLGGDAEALRAIVREANRLPKTILASDLPAAERTIVVPLDDRLAVVVVQVSDLFPLTREGFGNVSRSPRAHDALIGSPLGDALQSTFSLDQLMRRHGFALVREGNEET